MGSTGAVPPQGGVKLFVHGALGLPAAAGGLPPRSPQSCPDAYSRCGVGPDMGGILMGRLSGRRGARARAGKPAFMKMHRSLSNRVPETPERELGNS